MRIAACASSCCLCVRREGNQSMFKIRKDMTGQTCGLLTVIRFAGRSESGVTLWLCLCVCGKETTVRVGNLGNGHTTSCGKCITPAKDEVGNTHGLLTVISRAGTDNHREATWHCLCACGREITVSGGNLRKGNARSCGCARPVNLVIPDSVRPPWYTSISPDHFYRVNGKLRMSPELKAWHAAKTRCYNPNSISYEAYGGRGIRMSKEFCESFDAFYDCIGPRPSSQHSLDRIDVNGDYTAGNIRWATRSEQQRNKRPFKWKKTRKNFSTKLTPAA